MSGFDDLIALMKAFALAVRMRAERNEARALAIDLYLDANGVGPNRDWGAEEVPSWLSGEGGEVKA